MVNYKVTVFNGSPINAVTTNDVFIKLVGTDGEIEPNKLNAPISFTSTQVSQKYLSKNITLLLNFLNDIGI